MENNFFDKEFKFEEYLNERLMEVEDLDRRRDLKDVMRKVMLPFYEYTEKKYNCLLQKLEEKEEKKDDYTIVIGIDSRNHIDITDETMQPINMEDMEDREIDVSDLREHMHIKQPYYIFTVFMELDAKRIQKLISANKVFSGTIITSAGTYSACFGVKGCYRYQEKINNLYPVFVRNMVQWKTVNMSYLYKLVDIYLLSSEIPEDEEILEIKVDFEEYEQYTRYKYVPLWNISELSIRDNGYPEFCLDRINYIHTIYGHKLQSGSSYMVDNECIKILSIVRDNGDINITCDEKSDVTWKLLEFHKPEQHNGSRLPYLDNHDEYEGTVVVRTKTEIAYFIKALGYEDRLRFVNSYVEKSRGKGDACHDMNYALSDEICHEHRPYCLMLEFEAADKNNFLNRDILSYLVSRIQWEFPEYRCCGKLINDAA